MSFASPRGPDWDPTVPGKLQAELGDEYSGKPREQRAVQVGLRVQKGKPADLQYDEGLAKVQLVTKQGTRMVGVGPDVLSIHMLRPYQDLANFSKRRMGGISIPHRGCLESVPNCGSVQHRRSGWRSIRQHDRDSLGERQG